MTLAQQFGRVLAIAPHPDDEILGCGGTLARLVDEGGEVTIAVATTGKQPAFPPEQVKQVQDEMRRAHAVIGVKDTRLLDLPAAALDTIPTSDCNAPFADLVDALEPDTLLLPFVGDIHMDHQLTFLAAMVAARPRHNAAPRQIMCYETVSETNWYAAPTTPAFVPNVFVDISKTIDRKLDAFAEFRSQVRAFPDERSHETLRALAAVRGSCVHLRAAEAFMHVRSIYRV